MRRGCHHAIVATSLLAVLSGPSAAQSPRRPEVVVSPDRVEAGGHATIAVMIDDDADVASVEFDGKGVDADGFVRRMWPAAGYLAPGLSCPPQRRCFTTSFDPSVYLATGVYRARVSVVGARGRRITSDLPLHVTSARDDDADGLPDTWEAAFSLERATAHLTPGGDPDGDGVSTLDEFRRQTNPVARYARYFAEGSSGDRQPLTTRLLVGEVSAATAGRRNATRIVSVGDDGRRRESLLFDGRVMHDDAVADRVVLVVVESADRLVVERQTLNASPSLAVATPVGASAAVVNSSTGVEAPSRTWYFADGCTAGGLDMFLLAYNPGPAAVEAEFTYADDRREVLRRVRRLEPGVRTTVWVNRDDPEAMGSDVGVTIRAGGPIVVERAFRQGAPGRTVAHDSVGRGAQSAAMRWFFPDVNGQAPIDTTIAVLNPSMHDADLEVTTYFDDREPDVRRVAVATGVRRTLTLADLGVPHGAGASVGIRASVPVVAERATAFAARDGAWRRSTAGVTTSGVEWRFAQAWPQGWQSPMMSGELVITNVSDVGARVEVWSYEGRPGYMGGSRAYTFIEEVAPHRVVRIPFVAERSAGDRYIGADQLVVTSRAAGASPAAGIVVERTLRWDVAGVARAGASSIIGNVIR